MVVYLPTPLCFVCRLHCLLALAQAHTLSSHHPLTTRVSNVVGALRESTSFVVTRRRTGASTPSGARSVARDASLPITLDATWRHTQAHATTSANGVRKSSLVPGVSRGTCVTFIKTKLECVTVTYVSVKLGVPSVRCQSLTRVSAFVASQLDRFDNSS